MDILLQKIVKKHSHLDRIKKKNYSVSNSNYSLFKDHQRKIEINTLAKNHYFEY